MRPLFYLLSLVTFALKLRWYMWAARLPRWLWVKNPPANAGNMKDMGLIPGSGRSPGGGHGNPLQYSCLENPHGQRHLMGYSPLGHKESDTTKRLTHAHAHTRNPQSPALKTRRKSRQERGWRVFPWTDMTKRHTHKHIDTQPVVTGVKNQEKVPPRKGMKSSPLNNTPFPNKVFYWSPRKRNH